MNTKIKNVSSKLVSTIANLGNVLNESAKVFKNYVETILTEVDDDVEVDNECYNFCVTYDGGRHPEYDANPFSQIQRIYLKDGKIYVETEDADGLSFDDLDVLDKQTVAECLAQVIEDNYELDE